MAGLQATLRLMREDVRTVLQRDPAARTAWEAVLCYPGLHAVWMHRLTQPLWQRDQHTLARFLSQFARFLTGIEIHPAATLGRRLFIDHGMGVVIGETAVVGDDVTLYQGVTLGGTGKGRGKRHPTLGHGVTIGAGAKILGDITIGDKTRVGAGSVVLMNLPANATAVGVPAYVARHNGKKLIRIENNLTGKTG